jgi:hypothetical protein
MRPIPKLPSLNTKYILAPLRTACLLVWVMLEFGGVSVGQVSPAPSVLDSVAMRKIDSINAIAVRMAIKRDSIAKATSLAIALRDTINNPRPLRPEQIRADRKEHYLAAGAVSVLAVLTFLLYNLRTQ